MTALLLVCAFLAAVVIVGVGYGAGRRSGQIADQWRRLDPHPYKPVGPPPPNPSGEQRW
jgi:membrane protein DedA with SNARE-associated domain